MNPLFETLDSLLAQCLPVEKRSNWIQSRSIYAKRIIIRMLGKNLGDLLYNLFENGEFNEQRMSFSLFDKVISIKDMLTIVRAISKVTLDRFLKVNLRSSNALDSLQQILEDSAILLYMLGRGTDKLQSSDYQLLNTALKEQERYLNKAYRKNYLRLTHYANSVTGYFSLGRDSASQQSRWKSERWVLGEGEHCIDCQELASRGWVEIGSLPLPQSGETQCLGNCHCHKEYGLESYILRGGKGSGFTSEAGHKGRPGKVGGSSPADLQVSLDSHISEMNKTKLWRAGDVHKYCLKNLLPKKPSDELTESIHGYTESGYADLNNSLRKGKPLTQTQQKIYDDLMSNMKPIGSPIQSYRTIIGDYGRKVVANMKQGDYFFDSALISTSIFANWLMIGHHGASIKLIIAPDIKGIYFYDLSTKPSEMELLLEPNLMFTKLLDDEGTEVFYVTH